jgi:hypothetical protein
MSALSDVAAAPEAIELTLKLYFEEHADFDPALKELLMAGVFYAYEGMGGYCSLGSYKHVALSIFTKHFEKAFGDDLIHPVVDLLRVLCVKGEW